MGTPTDTAQYVGLLNTNEPADANDPTNGAASMRQIKTAVKQSFPNVDGAANPTDTELNALVGISTATTLAAQLAAKANLAGPTFTGDVALDASSGYPSLLIRPNDDTTFAGRIVMQNAAADAARFVLVADEGNDQLYLQWFAADGSTQRGQIAINSSNNIVLTPGSGGILSIPTGSGGASEAVNYTALAQYLASWDDTAIVANVADGAISTAKLAADAVTGAKLANDAVDSEHLTADAVTAAAVDFGNSDTAANVIGVVDGAAFNMTAPGLYIVSCTGLMSVRRSGFTYNGANGFAGGAIYSDGSVSLYNDSGSAINISYTKMS